MATNTATTARPPQQSGVNPFARALAEARGGSGDDQNKQLDQNAPQNSADTPALDPKEQQRQLLEKQRHEQLRMELHRRVNPVEQRDVFNARKEQISKEIEAIRQELKAFGQEVLLMKRDIQVTLMTQIPDPGEEGKYYLSFFKKLREFIALLRQQIHSARTWASAFRGKQSRKGLDFGARGYKQTKTVWDTMHHERAIARAGG